MRIRGDKTLIRNTLGLVDIRFTVRVCSVTAYQCLTTWL